MQAKITLYRQCRKETSHKILFHAKRRTKLPWAPASRSLVLCNIPLRGMASRRIHCRAFLPMPFRSCFGLTSHRALVACTCTCNCKYMTMQLQVHDHAINPLWRSGCLEASGRESLRQGLRDVVQQRESCRVMLSGPRSASQVVMAVSGTPQKPCRPAHWPVSSRLGILVTTGTSESAVFRQSLA